MGKSKDWKWDDGICLTAEAYRAKRARARKALAARRISTGGIQRGTSERRDYFPLIHPGLIGFRQPYPNYNPKPKSKDYHLNSFDKRQVTI